MKKTRPKINVTSKLNQLIGKPVEHAGPDENQPLPNTQCQDFKQTIQAISKKKTLLKLGEDKGLEAKKGLNPDDRNSSDDDDIE